MNIVLCVNFYIKWFKSSLLKMDLDSSAKFIGSLTKFLQSLCNGYVEFQNGVELVGHIYLNIDTGEKVDYILHEKVSKNDENSVSFVSNSFHALPACNLRAAVGSNIDRAEKGVLQTGTSIDSVNELRTASSDDDVIIIDQPYSSVGCNNFVPAIPKASKRKGSPYDELISARKFRDSVPPVTSDSPSCDALTGGCALLPCVERSRQENMDISDMKLEQMSNDELLSLTSHVGASGGHQSQSAIASIPHQSVMASEDSHGNNDVSWIKKEPPDLDPGNKALWFNDGGDLDSSPGSRMYPVMMHQSAGSFSAPVFPDFADSNAACTMATNMFDNPMAGTSQDIDPSDNGSNAERFPVLGQVGAGHVPSKILTRRAKRNCVYCSSTGCTTSAGNKIQTTYQCVTCGVALCKDRGCFAAFHEEL